MVQQGFSDGGLKWNHKKDSEEKDMTTYADFLKLQRLTMTMLLTIVLCAYASGAMAAEANAGKRLSITTQKTKAQRDEGSVGLVAEYEYDALAANGERDKGKRSVAQQQAAAATAQAPNSDFWFYSADVVLFNDLDRDGYYHGIDLLFDADTYYEFAEVYAVVYLSLDGGPWNEYAVTETFTIFGSSSEDDYVLVTELIDGYPTGSYDILIELFDAWDDSFVAWVGPEDTSELAFLPLEDADRDRAVVPDVVVINRGGGGSLGWLLILSLGLVAAVRRRLALYA